MAYVSPWTEIAIEELRQLWAAGASASVIARELGVTREAVLGKAFRLRLAHRKAPPAARPKPSQIWRPKTSLKPRPPFMPDKPLAPMPERRSPMPSGMRRLQLLELEPNQCRWPVGDPRMREFFFCGADADVGCIYCPHHMRRAFNRSRGV
jgi:GcrA cell cycle regulator